MSTTTTLTSINFVMRYYHDYHLTTNQAGYAVKKQIKHGGTDNLDIT